MLSLPSPYLDWGLLSASSPIADNRAIVERSCLPVHGEFSVRSRLSGEGAMGVITRKVARLLDLAEYDVSGSVPRPGVARFEVPHSIGVARRMNAVRALAEDLPGWLDIVIDSASEPAASPATVDTRAENRQAIDALLAADRSPFATARQAGILAAAEAIGREFGPGDASDTLTCLREYECLRGGMRKPSPAALAYREGLVRYPGVAAALCHYESARGMK